MKGILLKEKLYFATVKGDKTETRRVGSFKDFPRGEKLQPTHVETVAGEAIARAYIDDEGNVYDTSGHHYRPRYQVGEVVYLKEPHAVINGVTFYKFDFNEEQRSKHKWGNKLFMPESAARKFIKITKVWAERLVDITECGAAREGFGYAKDGKRVATFFNAFEAINGGDMRIGAPVWVYQYEIVD